LARASAAKRNNVTSSRAPPAGTDHDGNGDGTGCRGATDGKQ